MATECLVPCMRSKSVENVPVKKIGSVQASNDARPLHACLSEQYTRVRSMSPVNLILNCYLSFYISLPLWITTPIFFYGDQVLYKILKLSTYFNFYGKMVKIFTVKIASKNYLNLASQVVVQMQKIFTKTKTKKYFVSKHSFAFYSATTHDQNQ